MALHILPLYTNERMVMQIKCRKIAINNDLIDIILFKIDTYVLFLIFILERF